MPYTPSKHTVSNKSYGIAQAAPTDARSMFFDEDLFMYRPYQSLAEVNAYLNIPKYRTGNFPIFVNLTGSLGLDGIFIGGTIEEYWYPTPSSSLSKKSSVSIVSLENVLSLNKMDRDINATLSNGSVIRTTVRERYTHTQSIPSTVWTVIHNLDRPVNVSTFTDSGTQIYGEVNNTSINRTIITFAVPLTGTALIN